jgi:pyruvate formate lyase activating enzyme
MTSGIIFDLQRFSLHDGPGIRTAVFLKGCPLRCAWCHNPESQSRKAQVAFRTQACALCGACASACPQGAHTIDGAVHRYNRELCTACGKCVEACVYGALTLAGREASAASVIAEALRDRAYYEASGGGLTLTGGEPLAQLDFTLELLAAARAVGVHTCLETSGYASRRAFEKVLPLVDLFLYDYKVTDPRRHREWTGVDNHRILENLDWLLARGARVRLRCPLVPGVNDTLDHLRGIAALAERHPQLEAVDLLPYHHLGNDKYLRYGMENPLPGLSTTGEDLKQGWLDALQALGCAKVKMG